MSTTATLRPGAGATWRTWGRTETAEPVRVLAPTTEDEVVAAVREAADEGLRVKPVGAGHSFSAIAVAPDLQLDLAGLTGLRHADPTTGRVTVAAGTRLHDIPGLLAPHRLAMPNLGDIDAQSVSGAVSTGTHGTGLGFGGLATQVVGLRLVDGRGDVVVIDAEHRPDLLPAAALGLGALGVITEITLQCVPEFLLDAVEAPEPVDAVLAQWMERVRTRDHVEFYWFPHTGTALTKTNTRLPADRPRRPLPGWRRRLDDDLVANGLFGLTCGLATRVPAVAPLVNRVADRVTGHRSFRDLSPAVFTTRRAVRFREMEYAVPVAALPEVAREVMALIERRRWRISFPLEFRAAAADDRWLSTAYGRDSGYVAVHRYWRDRDDDYFPEVEALLQAHDGRPHWGKMHGRTAADLAPAYPRFGDFLAVRDDLDPDRVFANDYLERVLGG
ncbi:D-arabinono-1,4-lactone oxidase [Ornithinicoccus hortensis]|uniref:FAD-linked oxidoreductase n=1 Tax=Ornithinicoccus hortensis TaxID=82346 RepID=A0A542YWA0_9MICO|nr:D-arabinono-1,4-lactone oxidase [Ornithinicoccus hortensis]TQL52353.1 FAD-linked oxidoreductase [Ornithinicoccus hortensis]